MCEFFKLNDLPELSNEAASSLRIPQEMDVRLTSRALAVIDTPAMQRLKRISQLGLVGQVYPGAQHSRFEHSLGVYRLACNVFSQLFSQQPERWVGVTEEEVKIYLLAALLHDVGHWPFCHPIEDMRLPWVPRHEALARQLICSGELAHVIDKQWGVSPDAVANFLSERAQRPSTQTLQNILNGPVDIDKMDYLQRDSLHAGVPYGRNFDVGRLVNSLRVATDGSAIAISEKGKTAAEMMVFARYVMFSEVYWHHAVRSATAMLQRLVYRLQPEESTHEWLHMSDADFSDNLRQRAANTPGLEGLSEGLFGHSRKLYKRFAEFTVSESPNIHNLLARRPYEQLVDCSQQLAQRLSEKLAHPLAADDVLIDAPPVKLEVQFKLSVVASGDRHGTVALADISPVVKALATEQFDNFVKKVRVFIAPHRREELCIDAEEVERMLLESS